MEKLMAYLKTLASFKTTQKSSYFAFTVISKAL
eukprot:UN20042